MPDTGTTPTPGDEWITIEAGTLRSLRTRLAKAEKGARENHEAWGEKYRAAVSHGKAMEKIEQSLNRDVDDLRARVEQMRSEPHRCDDCPGGHDAEARAERAEAALREIRDDPNPFTGKHASRAVAIAVKIVGEDG